MKKYKKLTSSSLIICPFIMITILILVGCCSFNNKKPPPFSKKFQEVSYTELEYDQPDPNKSDLIETLSCQLSDLPPIGWKEVNSGLVDIRTVEAYEIQTASLYQQGFFDYQQNRLENPEKFEDLPEFSYEEYFEICNVFPEIDFSKYSLLGYHASGTGCDVSFEKYIYQNDEDLSILYQLKVIEKDDCETTIYNRNFILVAKIPSSYEVQFQEINQGNGNAEYSG